MEDALLRLLWNFGSDLVLCLDAALCVAYANPAALRALGYHSESIARTRLIDITPSEHASRWRAWIDAAYAHTTSEIFEAELCTTTGRIRFVSGVLRLHTFADGRSLIVMVLQDVTRERHFQDMVRDQEARYSSLLAALDSGVVMQHADGQIIACNASAQRILGLTVDQMMGRTSLDPRWRAIHADGSPFPGETHPAMVALQTGKPCRGIVMGISHPDGALIWIEISAYPLAHTAGTAPYAVVISFDDITERKQLEEDLQAREAQYAALFDQSIDAILIATSDGQLVAANREACLLFRTSEAELAADWRTLISDPSDLRWGDAIIERDRTGVFRGELRFRRADGTIFEGEVASVKYRERGGDRVSIVVRDVSQCYKLAEALHQSEQRQRAILETIPDLVWLKDGGGRYLVVNRAYAAFHGSAPVDIIGKDAAALNPPAVAALFNQQDQSALLNNAKQHVEIELVDYTGAPRWFDVVKSPIEDMGHGEAGTVGIAHDITRRKRLEREVVETLRRKTMLYELSDALSSAYTISEILKIVVECATTILPADRAVLMTIDHATHTVTAHYEGGQRALGIMPLTFAEIWEGLSGVVLRTGQPVLSPKGGPDARESEVVRARRERERAGSILVLPVQRQGTILGTLTAINDVDGLDFTDYDVPVLGTIANQAGIALERALLLAELQQRATTDMLTGLLNRRAWMEQSQPLVAIAEREGHPMSVLLVDVDHFKQVNDRYGHHTGDHVLQNMSHVLGRMIRRSDLLGRYGGEEFVVLLPETDMETARGVAERIREAVGSGVWIDPKGEDGAQPVTLSIGVSTALHGRVDLAALLDQADRALYTAKRAGRNRVVVAV